jgi:hypothetical protein
MDVGSLFHGDGFAIAMTMASAFPSKGVGCPAARFAVRGLGTRRVGGLGPGGEVGGGVAVRSEIRPQASQRKMRSAKLNCWLTLPHCEQVLEDGNHRFDTTTSTPNHAAL